MDIEKLLNKINGAKLGFTTMVAADDPQGLIKIVAGNALKPILELNVSEKTIILKQETLTAGQLAKLTKLLSIISQALNK